MTLTAVKATKVSAGTGSSITMTSLTATAGNVLIVGACGYENNDTTGAMSAARSGDVFTTDVEGNTSAATDLQHIGIASAPNVGAGPTNLVATVTSAIGISAFALEVSGPPSSGIRDANSPAIKIAASGTTATSNSLTNVTANAIFVALVGNESGANPVTITPSAGWTDTVSAVAMKETNGTVNPAGGMEFKIVSAVAANNGSWTVTTANWGAVIAVYKDTGAAVAAVLTPQRTLTGAGI